MVIDLENIKMAMLHANVRHGFEHLAAGLAHTDIRDVVYERGLMEGYSQAISEACEMIDRLMAEGEAR